MNLFSLKPNISQQIPSIPERWLQYDWLTLGLFSVGLIGYCLLLASVIFSILHPIVNIVLSVALGYIAFTVVHESVHGNLFAGDNKRAWLNDSIGWVAALPFVIIPSSVFKTLHLHHHAFLNDPERDPDYFCHSHHPLIALAKCTVLSLHYLVWYTRLLGKEQLAISNILSTSLYFCVWALIIGACVRFEWLTQLTLYAVLPAWLTSIILAWVFDHIVHHPHTEQDSYKGTNAYHFKGAKWLTLGQNSHVVHHVNPSIVWHQYEQHLQNIEQQVPKANPESVETILDMALRNEIAVPHLCKKGICGQCKMKIEVGEYELDSKTNNTLTATEQAQGYILICQSVAHPKDKDAINRWLSERYQR